MNQWKRFFFSISKTVLQVRPNYSVEKRNDMMMKLYCNELQQLACIE